MTRPQLLRLLTILTGLLWLQIALYGQVAVSKPAENNKSGETVFALIDNQYIHVDLKAISADKGSFGIDYKVQFSKTLIQEQNEMGRKWEFSVNGTGLLTAEPEKNDIDSIITEAAFKATPLWRVAPKGGGTIPPEILEDPMALKKWMEAHAEDYIS